MKTSSRRAVIVVLGLALAGGGVFISQQPSGVGVLGEPIVGPAAGSAPSPSKEAPGNDGPGRDEEYEECPEGIEGRGLGDIESYPLKPYFEEFNLWRTEISNTRRGCLRIAAGQQANHMSDGEDDPTTYNPNGALLIFGDYRRDPDGITGNRSTPSSAGEDHRVQW